MKLYSINISVIFILLICFQTSSAQNITYKCYLKSLCSKELKILDNYSLHKNSFHYYSKNGGFEANLQDTGLFVLKSWQLAVEGDSILVHITFGTNIDTIKQKDIVEGVFIDLKPLKGMTNGGGWFYCGKPCNGYNVDYYNNGKKNIEGRFKNGKPIGKLKSYNSNGLIKYIAYYNRRGTKFKGSKRFIN
jgi:hypothetical protein